MYIHIQKGFNPAACCKYYYDALGHSTEKCWPLKKEVKKGDCGPRWWSPQHTENAVSVNNNVHFIEMICDDKEGSNSLNSQEKTTKIGGWFIKANIQTSD